MLNINGPRNLRCSVGKDVLIGGSCFCFDIHHLFRHQKVRLIKIIQIFEYSSKLTNRNQLINQLIFIFIFP